MPDSAVLFNRGGDRGDPQRPDGGRLRRREPRERGRPHARRPVRHPRGDQLHGHPRARADLPGADAGALRRAGARPDGGQERVGVPNQLHGLDRGGGGGDHGDLRPRPRPHDPGRHRPQHEARRDRPAGARVPAQGQGRRRAGASRPDRGGRRSDSPRGPDPVRGDLRDHERGRDDGPGARPDPVLRAPRAEDDHGRRPDRLPATDGEAGRAGRLHTPADRLRGVRRGRLPLAGRRQAPSGDGQGRRPRQGRRAGSRPLRVPDRRRLPLAALRLRRAARGGAGDDRAGGRRRPALPLPGGAGDRPA